MNPIRTRRAGLLAALLLLAFPGTSRAAITGFQFNGIEAVSSEGGKCDFQDRLGTNTGDDEHYINIDDCSDYSGCEMRIQWSVTGTITSGTQYSVKMSVPGGTCSETDLTTVGGTSCLNSLLTQDVKNLESTTNNKVTVDLNTLMAGEGKTLDCAGAGTDQSTKIYFIISEAGVIQSYTLSFAVDLKRPGAPALEEPTEGDANVTVKWKDGTNDTTSGIRYRVYWSPQKFGDANKTDESVDSSGLVTGTSYQVEGLENDTEYWFGVVAVDASENESPLSALTSAMPVEVDDFFELYKGAGGAAQGGFCFVATAAYGSPMAGELDTLRTFRDRFLMSSLPGSTFVSFYYAASPAMAAYIAQNETLRAITRGVLWPIVEAASLFVAVPAGAAAAWALALLLAGGVIVGVVARRRGRGA